MLFHKTRSEAKSAESAGATEPKRSEGMLVGDRGGRNGTVLFIMMGAPTLLLAACGGGGGNGMGEGEAEGGEAEAEGGEGEAEAKAEAEAESEGETCIHSSWTVETLPTSTRGCSSTALTVDSLGTLYVLCIDSADYTTGDDDSVILLERSSDGMWVAETLDTEWVSGMIGSTILFDPSGIVHVVYHKNIPGTTGLRHAFRDQSGTWSYRIVFSPADPNYASLAVGPDDRIHLTSDDPYSSTLQYGQFAVGEDWTVEPVDLAGSRGFANSLGVDRSSGIHVSYQDNAENLGYAYRPAGGSWTLETVDSSVDQSTSLVLDESETPHVVYAFWNDPESVLRYATRDAGRNWTIEDIQDAGMAAWGASLAIDGSGQAHVSYTINENPGGIADNSALGYARRNSSGVWSTERVDCEGGRRSSIGIDPVGCVHITYNGESKGEGGFKHAYRCP